MTSKKDKQDDLWLWVLVIVLIITLSAFAVFKQFQVNILQEENQALKTSCKTQGFENTTFTDDKPCEIFDILPIDNDTFIVNLLNCEVIGE